MTACAAALSLRILSPSAAEKIGHKLTGLIAGDVDIEAAVTVLGEAVREKTDITDALKKAYVYAFVPGNNAVEASIEEDGAADIPPASDIVQVPDGDYIQQSVETGRAETDISDIDVKPEDPTPGINDSKSEGELLVNKFKASQAVYEDLEAPVNVTYERPEIDIDCTSPLDAAVTSGFGYREHPNDGKIRFHYGTDIGASEGTDAHAFASGTVHAVGNSSSYGLYVMLTHDDGLETLYAHLSQIKVREGDAVNKGDVIGLVGSTGNATGGCLHFEVIQDGVYLNPEYYI